MGQRDVSVFHVTGKECILEYFRMEGSVFVYLGKLFLIPLARLLFFFFFGLIDLVKDEKQC